MLFKLVTKENQKVNRTIIFYNVKVVNKIKGQICKKRI